MSHLFDAITQGDRAVFLALNHLARCPFMDWVMPRATDAGLGHVQAIAVLIVASGRVLLADRTKAPRRLARAARWAIAVAALAAAVYALSGALQRHSPEGMGAATVVGCAFLVVLLGCVALPAASGQRRWVGPLLVAFALSGLASTAMKRVPRDPPWWFYEQRHHAGQDLAVQVGTVPGVYPLMMSGFPSGHTATTVAMATVVTILFRRRRRWLVWAAWVAAATVGFSRVYLGSHWPLDVLGGALLGVVSGAAAVWLCRMWAHPPGSRHHTEQAEAS